MRRHFRLITRQLRARGVTANNGGPSLLAVWLVLLSHTAAWAAESGRSLQRTPVEATRAYEAARTQRKTNSPPALPVSHNDSLSPPTPGGPSFTLEAIDVTGANAIPHEDISAAYQAYIGTSVTRADLVAIAGTITAQYRDAGFSLSRAIVPAQDIKDGRVRVEVLEGYIEEVVLEGSGVEDFGAREVLAVLKEERPVRQSTFERQLLLVNDTPGVRVADTAIEEQGEATGRFRLVVTLESWHLYLGAGLDNLGTPAVGRLQGYLAPAVNSVTLAGDTLGLTLSSVPDETKELRLGYVIYDAPVGNNGSRIAASASYGEIWPGDQSRQDHNHTAVARYEIKGTVVPMRTRETSNWVSLSGDVSDVRESDEWGTISDDHVRALTIATDLELHDPLAGANYLTAKIRKGLDIFGASTNDDALLSRWDGTGVFTAAYLFYTRYQKLSDEWSLSFTGAGQLASTTLLASEEFYLGGATFGRAYDSGEVSGDNALAASLEVRYDQAVQHTFITGYQLYAFVDHGIAWDLHGGPDDRHELTSAGGGARMYFPRDLQGSVEIAVPVAERPLGSEVRDFSVYFSLSQSFKLCPGELSILCPNS